MSVNAVCLHVLVDLHWKRETLYTVRERRGTRFQIGEEIQGTRDRGEGEWRNGRINGQERGIGHWRRVSKKGGKKGEYDGRVIGKGMS